MDTRTFAQVVMDGSDSIYQSPTAVPQAAQFRKLKRWFAEVNSPVRVYAFYFGLLYTFTIFSQLHQLIGMVVKVDLHLLWLIGLPMIVFLLASEGLQRTLRWPVARYWVGFSIWMVITIPFSTWRSQSLVVALVWVRAEVLVLFVIAGCVLTWREFKTLMSVLACAAAVDVIAGRLIAGQVAGRFDLTGTTMSDPNDYAAQLVLVLPCLLWVILSSSRLLATRIVAALVLLYGILLILLTGSRGGLVALLAAVLFCLWKLHPREKLIAAVVILLLACATPFVVPQKIMKRFAATFQSADLANKDPDVAGAIESSEGRAYLLKQSILATLNHPLFGVGAGQFSNYEGNMAREMGRRGAWHETHNSYTQISSEIGIPALLFFLAAVFATYRLLNKVYREAQRGPRTRETLQIKTTAFCLMVSMVGFCTASFFLTLGYRFYMPALTGLAIALYRSARQKWQLEGLPTRPKAAPLSG